MNFLESLAKECLEDEYFIYLLEKAEIINGESFFSIENSTLSEKEFSDLLRFSDILSNSKSSDALNKSFKIISLLIERYKEKDYFLSFAKSILIKIGNFPAIKFLEDKYEFQCGMPMERFISKTIKEDYQRIPNTDLTFTDSQFEIFERLKNSNHFSFSGPTSLGKSFVISSFIRFLISEHKETDNIVVLVPTRALINQTVNQLKSEFKDVKSYKVLAYPKVPTSFKAADARFIFVFTPERLLAYLSDHSNPKLDYLFVDEAHKIISIRDSRSPLYYHAILQAEKKSVKLFFASPNIPNPEVFLKIFEKSNDEALSINNSPVSQSRYFMDFVNKECTLFTEQGNDIKIPLDFYEKDFFYWLIKLSNKDKSIIYCNSKRDTIDFALEFSKKLPPKKNESLNELISIVQDNLHADYFLIDCLKKGVGFHFGNLPQDIREKVEILFAKGDGIDYLFCTSTLLEGVNLPAKNIFILSNAIGLTKFTDIDFWNLAGRAGRMTKELSGNIICARIKVKNNRWNEPEKDLNVVRNKASKSIDSILSSGKGNFYKNLERSIKDEPFTNKSASYNEINIWNHYANIAQIHEVLNYDSTLKSNFIKRVASAKETLEKSKKKNIVPERILSFSSMIKPKYQNDFLMRHYENSLVLNADIVYENCLEALNTLYHIYDWKHEESHGRRPVCRTKDSLKYYAVLLSSWMTSTPLNLMVLNSLKHFDKKGEIWDESSRCLIPFKRQDKTHINMVINELITDIDHIVRFKLKNYFDNYFLLLTEKLGENYAGENWAEFLEYGTNDRRVMELQNIGFSRHLSLFLLDKYSNHLSFRGNDLIKLDIKAIASSLVGKNAEYEEFAEVLSLEP